MPTPPIVPAKPGKSELEKALEESRRLGLEEEELRLAREIGEVEALERAEKERKKVLEEQKRQEELKAKQLADAAEGRRLEAERKQKSSYVHTAALDAEN